MNNEYHVRATPDDRASYRGKYVVRMSHEAAEQTFGSSRPQLVVISRKCKITDTHQDKPFEIEVEINAAAWLHVGVEENGSSPGVIELDQTIRQALGLRYDDYANDKVSVHRIQLSQTWNWRLSRIVGRRLIYCRPAVFEPVDIEKNIARLPSSAINLMAVGSGERITLCGVLKDGSKYYLRSWSAAAMEATDKYMDGYATRSHPNIFARFPRINELIYGRDELDLYPVFVDADVRRSLFGSRDKQRSRFSISGDVQLSADDDSRI